MIKEIHDEIVRSQTKMKNIGRTTGNVYSSKRIRKISKDKKLKGKVKGRKTKKNKKNPKKMKKK